MTGIEILLVDEMGTDGDGQLFPLRRHAYVCGPGGGPVYAGLDGSTVVGAVAAWLDKTVLRPVRPGGEPHLRTIRVELVPSPKIAVAEGFIPHVVRSDETPSGLIALTDQGGAASPVTSSLEALEKHRPLPGTAPRGA